MGPRLSEVKGSLQEPTQICLVSPDRGRGKVERMDSGRQGHENREQSLPQPRFNYPKTALISPCKFLSARLKCTVFSLNSPTYFCWPPMCGSSVCLVPSPVFPMHLAPVCGLPLMGSLCIFHPCCWLLWQSFRGLALTEFAVSS